MTSTDAGRSSRPCGINLDILFLRLADAPRHVIVTGLDLTGVVPGRLHGHFPSVEGD